MVCKLVWKNRHRQIHGRSTCTCLQLFKQDPQSLFIPIPTYSLLATIPRKRPITRLATQLAANFVTLGSHVA